MVEFATKKRLIMKAVFFDIDGTLLDFFNFIPQSTKDGIKALRANGHKAYLCTGRSRGFVVNKELLSIGWDGIVCSCGAHVENNGKIIYQHIVDPTNFNDDIEWMRSIGYKPILEGPTTLYFDLEDFPMDNKYGNRLRGDLGNDIPFIRGNEGKWVFNKFSVDTENTSQQLGIDHFAKDWDAIIHSETVMEFVPKGHTKATGMKVVCDDLGITMADTIAFGDSPNDLDMLREAGFSVCMGNGTDDAKAASDYVTTGIMDDGIYNGLKYLKLI